MSQDDLTLDKKLSSLRLQRAEAEENLLLIQERKAESVLGTDISLQLIKQERRYEQEIARLNREIDGISTAIVRQRDEKEAALQAEITRLQAENARLTQENEELRVTARQAKTEVAHDSDGEEAKLQTYFERMSVLMLTHNLHPQQEAEPNITDYAEVSRIASNHTYAVLQNIQESARKVRVVQFLYESNLIYTQKPVVNLRRAELKGLDLAFVNLRKANLVGANLAGVNLVGSNLANANLRRTRACLQS
jgi:uncharacterized protein YjbI with pentapeptide repeats